MPISIEQARKYYEGNDPTHDFDHVLRVLHMAEHLAKLEGADVEIVRAAALLHDISRLEDSALLMQADPETDHAVLAARAVRQILAGETPGFIDAVAHCIEAHRFRNNIEPQTIEAKVLFDADKLDSIGAIGIARAFAYAGTLGNPLWGDIPDGYSPLARDKTHTPRHEFEMKLKLLKDRLYTDSGRRIAAGRHDYMVSFFDQMSAEIEGQQ
jgi:uncharacterized protein